jgi:hypothetical protein
MADAVVVINLPELQRALRGWPKEMSAAARLGLREGADRVRIDDDRLARANISGLRRTSSFARPAPWSIQKVGMNQHEVYVVPKEKGIKGRKTAGQEKRAQKFVELMYGRSYEPSLERNEPFVRKSVENWLDRVAKGFNTGGF